MARIEVTDEQITAAQAGDSDAMWAIVEAFDPMFTGMIRSAAPGASREDAEDLLQEARAVLIQHVRDYRTDASSAKLSSFVFQAARRRIMEEAVRSSAALTVDPTSVLRVKRALWSAKGDVEEAWQTLSTCSNPKNRMERERFVSVVEALADAESLDRPLSGPGTSTGDDEMTLADVIPDTSYEAADAGRRCDLARWLMTQIPARQSFALRAFYGVGMTQQDERETCADLSVRPAALRRLRSRGVESARRVAADHGICA
ncbi:hypothetical protein [Streptomyces sp. bgisy159]|uniref:hypothetical protein n=1 Tax=Streptomyces sp. bgisy159 TaxID=3413795 RepID=UPI003F4A75C7